MAIIGALLIRQADGWTCESCGGDIPAMREAFKDRVRADGSGASEAMLITSNGEEKRTKFKAKAKPAASGGRKKKGI